MNEAQSRYRASKNGKLKHREHMREYMTEWRKRRKESADYNVEGKDGNGVNSTKR